MTKQGVKICFIGGDDRQKYAAEELSSYVETSAFGDCYEDSTRIFRSDNLIKSLHNSKAIILPLPASKVEKYADFEMISGYAKENGSLILGGCFSQYMKNMMDSMKINYCDYYYDEPFTIENAYITAEGAINIISNELKKTLTDTSFALLGYGRIGCALCEMLSSLKCDVRVYARREESLALARQRGIKGSLLNEYNKYFEDVIINTIPSRVISSSQLLEMKEGTLIVELASAPGGFDFEIAEQSGLKTINGGGLPGKYAPQSAGKKVAKVLLKILKKERLL